MTGARRSVKKTYNFLQLICPVDVFFEELFPLHANYFREGGRDGILLETFRKLFRKFVFQCSDKSSQYFTVKLHLEARPLSLVR